MRGGAPVYAGRTTQVSAGNPTGAFDGPLTGASTEHYAIFAAGSYWTSQYSDKLFVDAYDKDQVKHIAPPYEKETVFPGGARADEIAVFAGGLIDTMNDHHFEGAYAYTDELVQSKVEGGQYARCERWKMGSCSIGNKAIFMGGETSETGLVDDVCVFDGDFSIVLPDNLSERKTDVAVTPVGGYALCIGGTNYYRSGTTRCTNLVEYYDADLTRGQATQLPVNCNGVAGTFGNKAVFVTNRITGSLEAPYGEKAVFAYDDDLTQTVVTQPFPDEYNFYGSPMELGDNLFFVVTQDSVLSNFMQLEYKTYNSDLTLETPEITGPASENTYRFAGQGKLGDLLFYAPGVDVYTLE